MLVDHGASGFSTGGTGVVFSDRWDVAAGVYQALPLLLGTLITSGIAVLLGVPVALAVALSLRELSLPALRRPLGLALDMSAAIPSVVWGLWALVFLAPGLLGAERWLARTFAFIPWIGGGTPRATNVFLAGVVLAIMILPVIAAGVRDPFARADIARAALVGLGRALGETIAVLLVVGDHPAVAHHLFGQGYTLAAAIANELGAAAGPHREALFAVGVVLFAVTLLVNAAALIRRRTASMPPRQPRSAGASARPTGADQLMPPIRAGGGLLALVPLILLILWLIRRGLPVIDLTFFTTDPTGAYFGSTGGARSAILGSLEIVALATLLSAPLGIAAGRSLSRRTGPVTRAVTGACELLAGVPAIVVGLFIYITFVAAHVNGAFAGWKGALAIALVMLPLITRAAAAALARVPGGVSARRGVVAGVLGAAAIGIGEAAPLLFTAASPTALSFDPTHAMNSLPLQILGDISAPRPAVVDQAWGAALVLVVIVAVLMLAAGAVAGPGVDRRPSG